MQTLSRSPFTTVKTEGGILPADLLSRVAGAQIDGLKPTDYHLAPTERLNEAISRSWNRLLGVWRSFDDQRRALAESDRGTTLTRERWLLILFQELGYGRLQFLGKLTVATDSAPSTLHPSASTDCWLERWSQNAAEQGTRALDALRDGVQEAIGALGVKCRALVGSPALRARANVQLPQVCEHCGQIRL